MCWFAAEKVAPKHTPGWLDISRNSRNFLLVAVVDYSGMRQGDKRRVYTKPPSPMPVNATPAAVCVAGRCGALMRLAACNSSGCAPI
jgi:hypothetical protein